MTTASVATKKCPLCAEDIRHDAVKCKHCGSMLVTQRQAPRVEKRLGVGGGVWMTLGAVLLGLALFVLSHHQVGPGLALVLLSGIFVWFAWNTGAVRFACPGCSATINATMKASSIDCARCKHRVVLRPQ